MTDPKDPTPEEIRRAAGVVSWGATKNPAAEGFWIFVRDLILQEADRVEAKETARRERLVEELAQTMYKADARSWPGPPDRDLAQDIYSHMARAVIDRFPSLLEAES